MIKYAMISSTARGYHSTAILAAIIIGINFASRLIAAIVNIPAFIQPYKYWKQEYGQFKMEETAEKNQE